MLYLRAEKRSICESQRSRTFNKGWVCSLHLHQAGWNLQVPVSTEKSSHRHGRKTSDWRGHPSIMKCLIRIIKLYPIITTFFIMVGLTFACMGIGISNYTYPIFGHSLFVDLCVLIVSIKLRFCVWHQLLMLNLVLVIIIEWFSVNFGFIPDAKAYIRLLLFITSGFSLTSSIFYYKHGCFKTTARKSHRNAR